jgi:hypothetical protein
VIQLANETDWRISPPAGYWGAPDCGFQAKAASKAAAVMAMWIMGVTDYHAPG